MPAAPVPSNDALRVATLQTFEILDTPPDPAFDEIVEIAARVCDTPTALVTLVDATRQWFKARVGFPSSETDRARAFCSYTIAQRELLEVTDATADIRFADNPLVTEPPHVRFYAGVPLVTSEDHALGSLAVIDYRPRKLTGDQRAMLGALANQVVAQLELRRRLLEFQRRSAIALERRDRHLSVLLEAALDAIVVIDHHGRIVELNPAAARTFGLARAAAIGEDMAERLIPARLRDAHRRGLAAYLVTGQTHVLGRRIETTAQRADGSEFPVELTITRLGNEEPPLFAGFLRDVTDRRRAETQLRRSVERFELAARATHDVIWDWDIRTDEVWWSDAFALHFGYPADQLVPSLDTWLDLLHADDRTAFEQSIQREIDRRGVYWTCEYRLRRGDGTYAQVMDRGYITYDAEGRPLRMIGALADMTARRRLEEQLVRAQKMEVIGQLSSGLAHDFNNLLTIIQCNAFMLGEEASGEHTTYVSDILYATERAANLTRQLLLLGRKQRLREAAVDLNRFVEEMRQLVERTLTARIALKSTIAPSVPAIRADASMLEQVLLNLVLNARDAIVDSGTITVATSQVTLDEPIVRHGLVGGAGVYACLSVQDSGTGIPAEALPHIFEPFFTTKDVGRGTGLGLSTVHHIVKEHRGWIDVSSTPGRGTTFLIALPSTADVRTREAAPFTTGELPTGTETILVVEDETLIRERIAKLLRKHGYDVIECESGPAALDAWRAHSNRIDLVLSDLVMPGGLDGRQVVQRLRVDRPELPAIYASGFTPEHAGAGETLVDGVNFLEKPYAPNTLLQLIRRRLDARTR